MLGCDAEALEDHADHAQVSGATRSMVRSLFG
jgi:hypothetical protein